MYLSRLILNPRTRRVRRELADPYQLHRTLMAAFPEQLPAGERVLYRVDVDARSGVPTVLMQSQTRPDWAWLGDPLARDLLQRAPESKPFEPHFAAGQLLAFRLRANPTVKRRLPTDKDDPSSELKPMRIPITAEDELLAWLARKGRRGGFRPVNANVISEGDLIGHQPRRDGADPAADDASAHRRRRLTFRAVRYEGLLEVTDPDALVQALAQGIGPAKAFGFGLLSLAPAGG